MCPETVDDKVLGWGRLPPGVAGGLIWGEWEYHVARKREKSDDVFFKGTPSQYIHPQIIGISSTTSNPPFITKSKPYREIVEGCHVYI